MAKTRLSNDKRDGLLAWMMEQYDERHASDLEKPRARALKAMNTAIRKKYPEADMAVLRKYELTRRDRCLRFLDSDTNQLFGFDWGFGDNYDDLADVPSNGGCRSDSVFVVNPREREAIEAFEASRSDAKAARDQKRRDYRSFLEASRWVEDVHEVVPLPQDLQRQYMSGMALIPVNQELVATIKKEFAIAAR